MAIMWPRKLPPDVVRNPLRSSECETYRRLQAALDDSFTVFYSRPWLGLTPTGDELDGECDFVVAHPKLGLLAIEVKGGAISYDAATDRWTSRDRWGLTHNIRNPVHQARTSKHRILEKLKESPGWSPRRIRARHGVIFPTSQRPGRDLGADMPLRIFCFQDQFSDGLEKWVRDRLGDLSDATSNERDLGSDGVAALQRLLAYPFQLKTPLGVSLAQDDEELQLLTQQQFQLLTWIENIPRVAVSGAAGTGKTVLAIEEARRCATAGRRTLFTCISPPLARHVQDRIGALQHLTVANFHALAAALAGRAGVFVPDRFSERAASDLSADTLMRAFDLLSEARFDAIIADEGQDFLPLWWAAIDAGLMPGPASRLRIFFDSNQRVYESIGKLPEDVQLAPIRLTQNLRNTQRIHSYVMPQYEGFAITAPGPQGVPVELVKTETARSIPRRLEKLVTRLIAEKLRPEDIAVLVDTEDQIRALAPRGQCAGLPSVRAVAMRPAALTIDTIRHFKGLDTRAVIVVCTAGMAAEKELPYVAFSRARTHLILLGPAAVVDQFRNATTTETTFN